MKHCKKCGQDKDFSSFSKNKNKKDGLQPWCKQCTSEYRKSYDKKPERKEKNKQRQKDWWDKNRERGNARQRNYRKNNEKFRLSNALRARVKYALIGCTRQDKTFDLLGCSPEQWKNHLEKLWQKGMSWENYGEEWEVDHIIPISHFDLTNIKEQKKAFHYTNTQPVWWDYNRSKGNRWIG